MAKAVSAARAQAEAARAARAAKAKGGATPGAQAGAATKPRAVAKRARRKRAGPARVTAEKRARAADIAARLAAAIPDPRCELDHASPWQLLVATILSAQTTDKGVNKITPELFREYPTPRALADAPQVSVERLVRSSGYFRQKARNLRAAAKLVAEKHGGEVPRTVEELTKLPGVARKTANVVLGTAYAIPSGIPVDTHVQRVARRLGLTRAGNPVAIERDLMAVFPQDQWTALGHRLVLHGRYTCVALAPRCPSCPLLAVCRAPESRRARDAAGAAGDASAAGPAEDEPSGPGAGGRRTLDEP